MEDTEFEPEIAAGDPKSTLDALKRNALDRLAETLARFKSSSAGKKAKSLDAKHVTSVTLMEDNKNKRVVMFCSKNDGIDPVDKRFLEELARFLQLTLGKGTQNFL